jgi:malate dehydrogenase (oxaloacetate-decarboxylating)
MTIYDESLELHEKLKGKLEMKSKVSLNSRKDLSLAYTPGVAEACRRIAQDHEEAYKYTIKGNTVAVITDGSAVLGLGNIGPEAALPVMEGKAILFKEFADIDAFPICLATQDIEKNIATIKNISPVFGGINLEDIKAPDCFELEKQLQDLGIPVMHDDQHGTAVVVLAALLNALKVAGKDYRTVKIVVNGAGAAGIAVTKLLISYGFSAGDIRVIDSKGAISAGRKDLNEYKIEIAKLTNKDGFEGKLSDAIIGADVFIGVSVKDVLKSSMVATMNENSIVMAMANPDPEILPEDAIAGGAMVVATGRSDFPNQVNNVLAFPGIFRGALDARATKITEKMKLAAAEALSNLVKSPSADKILPDALDKSVVPAVAKAVMGAWEP